VTYDLRHQFVIANRYWYFFDGHMTKIPSGMQAIDGILDFGIDSNSEARSHMRFRLGLLVAGFLAASGFATAAFSTFTTNPGDSTGGGPVNASATFTTGNGTISITLSNLLTAAQVVDVAQNLSDLQFTLSNNVTATVNDTNRSYSGTLVNVDGSGNVTAGSGLFNGWDLLTNSANTFTLEDLGSIAGPAQTIIGGAGALHYANANGSITTSGSHNPFLQGSATFTLTGFTGVTANTTVTAATFSFGTVLGSNVTGHLTPTPEPKVMSFVLVAGLLVLSRFRRKNVELS
jgi:hypothetical protein